MKKNYFIYLILLLSSHLLLAQNIIHVSTNGSDNNGTGSFNAPYASIHKASLVAQPGDTVLIHEGTYHNSNFGDGDIWKGSKIASLNCNGTSDAWITFKPYQGDHVLYETDARGIIIRGSYIVFSGFEMKAMADHIDMEEAINAWGLYKDTLGTIHDLAEELNINYKDSSLWGKFISKPIINHVYKPPYYNASFLVAKGHHIIIENNIIHDVCASALRNQGGDYITIRNNIIWGSTYWTSVGVGALTVAEAKVKPEGDNYEGIKIIIESNIVYDNGNMLVSWTGKKDAIRWVIDEGSGIFLTRNNDTYDHGYMLIANNISYLNGSSGIVVHKTNRAIVEHNTCYYNGQTNTGKAGGIGMNTTIDVTIRNNISWAPPNKAALYKVGGQLVDLVIEGNIIYNENGSHSIISGIPNEGFIETNPILQDVSNFNFQLTENSPAINNGVTNIHINYDITGYARNDGQPDIGAYEFNSDIKIFNIDFAKNLNVKVYPNPANKQFTIKYNIDQPSHITIVLYDQKGHKIKVLKQNKVTTGQYIESFELIQQVPGIYYVKIISEHGIATKPLILSKIEIKENN